MIDKPLIPRVFEQRVRQVLERNLVVLLVGPRQTGKTTSMCRLAEEVPADWHRLILDLDQQSLRRQLERKDHEALIDMVEAIIGGAWKNFRGRFFLGIDEAQKVPGIFEQVKILHDQGKGRIQIVLTGSSALDIMDRAAESLAGRALRIPVSPLTLEEASQLMDGEDAGYGVPGFWEMLLSGEMTFEYLREWGETRRFRRRAFEERWERLLLTGLMPAVVAEEDLGARFDLLRGYRESYIDRDVRQLEMVNKLSEFDQMLELLAAQSPGILNKLKLSKETGLHQETVKHYLSVLQASFLVELLQPWRPSQGAALTKRPKVYFCDTGWLAQLLGIDTLRLLQMSNKAGAFAETLIHGELKKHIGLQPMPPRLHFWRTLSGSEIDFVVSTGAHLIPIEVKAGARAGSRETRHLKVLEKPRVRGWRRIPYRILFHSGELQELGRDLWAIPFWFLG